MESPESSIEREENINSTPTNQVKASKLSPPLPIPQELPYLFETKDLTKSQLRNFLNDTCEKVKSKGAEKKALKLER